MALAASLAETKKITHSFEEKPRRLFAISVFFLFGQRRTKRRPILALRMRTKSGFSLCCNSFIDPPLLQNRQDIVRQPVKNKAGSKDEEHDREDYGHDVQHLCLGWICRLRIKEDLQEHGDCHQQRQNEPRIRHSQVGHPAKPFGTTQFNACKQHPIQCQKYRNLPYIGVVEPDEGKTNV